MFSLNIGRVAILLLSLLSIFLGLLVNFIEKSLVINIILVPLQVEVDDIKKSVSVSINRML